MKYSENSKQSLYLVTGATGNVGRHLVNELIERGHRVRALTRNPAKAGLPESAEVLKGDLNDPETVAPALKGVTGVYLIAFGGDDYAPLQTTGEIVKLAKQAGVKRATVLTGSEDELAVVRTVEESGIEWTHLRPPVAFMSNVLEWKESIRDDGAARGAFTDLATAMIHEADIAAVAATALTENGHAGKEYILTGPEALTPVSAVEIIGKTIGRDIRFEERTEEEERERMKGFGIDNDVIEFVISWSKNPPPEAYTVVRTVEEITGRPARTFRQWAEEHAGDFR